MDVLLKNNFKLTMDLYLIRLRIKALAFSIVIALFSCQEQTDQEINLTSLLYEMVDRDNLARFPDNGYETKQSSSYNRESISPDLPGWYADSDGVSWIRTEEINGQTEWVIMEDDGPGVITKIWAVCFYYGLDNVTGANIKFYLDGATEPVIATNFFDLVQGKDFVKAPFADESTRAGNLYFPIPYAKSCKITMDKKAFYNIINYRKYPAEAKIKTFTMADFNAIKTVREEIGKELTTTPNAKGKYHKEEKFIGKEERIAIQLPKTNGSIRQIEIQLDDSKNKPQALRSLVLSARFDGEQTVWVPVGDFFGNVGRTKVYDMWERSIKPDGTMICRWVMPYEKEGEIALINYGEEKLKATLKVTTDSWKWNTNSMHFYATWQMDEPTPTFPLFDYNFLEAEGKGVVVGDEWVVLNPIEGWWGEGDEKIYIDDDFEKNFPSHFGTGTEDYYGWAGGIVPTPADEFSKPFLGNLIVGEQRSKGYNVCARTRVLDAIPFRKKIKFDMESSCGKRSKSHFLQYAQTTFWYGIPGVTHNRKPLPEMASRKLPQIEDLEKVIAEAQNKQYIVEGAIEAEILTITDKSEGIIVDFAEIGTWGDMSGGSVKNIWFEKPGDFIEFNLTEQFEKSALKFAATVGPNHGRYKVSVNGKVKTTQDLYSGHPGITNPYVSLGDCEPVNNAFSIRFEFTGNNEKASHVKGKFALGLDFFLIQNEFLTRK